MPDPKNHWLLEPHVQHFFANFPTPLAVLRSDGSIVALNTRFTDSYDAACLESEAVQQLVKSPSAVWTAISLIDSDGNSIPGQVKALRAEDNAVFLLFSEPLDNVANAELRQLRLQLSQLEHLVVTDRLTGAWNRAYLDRMIELEFSRSTRNQQPLSLVMLDIDHFKNINDRHGHQIGDIVLQELVRVVQAQIRKGDLLFRWGGEEFVVMAPSTDYRAAAVVAEKIRAAVANHDFPGVARVNVSLGVAERLPDETAADCFKRVDMALYAAKDGGRNRVVVDRRGCSDNWAKAGIASTIRLQWSEAYECGEATIDAQHRKLFDLSNRLIETAFDGNPGSLAFHAAFDALLAHVAQHFADEEVILRNRRYAKLDAHQRAHESLLARAAQLKAKSVTGDVTLGEVVEFLAHDVVARHLLTADRDFFPLFMTPAAAVSAA